MVVKKKAKKKVVSMVTAKTANAWKNKHNDLKKVTDHAFATIATLVNYEGDENPHNWTNLVEAVRVKVEQEDAEAKDSQEGKGEGLQGG